MRKFSKRTTAIVSGATAVGLVTLGTVAYAAFTSSANADAGNTSGAEKFKPITVTSATWLGVREGHADPAVSLNLLPGEFGDVRLQLKNPSANTVNGKITKIEPVLPTAPQIGGVSSADKAECLSMLIFNTYNPNDNQVVVPNNGNDYGLDLNNAVQLKSEADSKCQGMTFPTRFTISFAATRTTATSTNSLLP